MSAALTVIGCGNLNRRDDGVGVLVAQRLAARLAPHLRQRVAVVDAGTDGIGVMLRSGESPALIVVDASRSGSVPGSIYEVPGAELEAAPPPAMNLHDFRWDHALYAGRRMHGERFARDVRVFLIEAGDLSFGIGLSAAVENAARRVEELIGERIAALAAAAAEDGVAEGAASAATPATLRLRRGSLRLPRELYERHFADLDAVLALPRGDDLLILPVRGAAGGGQLMKIVNAAGDRAVSLVELLRAVGPAGEARADGLAEETFAVHWSDGDSALIVERFFC